MTKPSLHLNNHGSLLIVAFTVLYVIILLTAGFSLLTFGELNTAQRYRDSSAALWLAETGIARFTKDQSLLDHGGKTLALGNGTIYLSKDDSLAYKRIVTSTGMSRGTKRKIQVAFAAKAPLVFDNSMSTAGNFVIDGAKSAVTINSRLRSGGKIINKSKHPVVLIEDKKEKVPAPQVSLIYPDANKNGKPDEFDDFIQFNRNLLASYPQDDVVYIKGSDTYDVAPNQGLTNKRILYIEGNQGKGDVLVRFSGPWQENQNLTIITTGKVTFDQTIKMPASSQLNIISWEGYFESSALPSVHNGTIYTHGVATFDHIYDSSVTNGNVIANGGIKIGEVWSNKTFNFSNTRKNSPVPPGFEGLIGARSRGYDDHPLGWQEM